MKRIALILGILLVASACLAQSDLYPYTTNRSWKGIQDWAQPRTAYGTSLPEVASGTTNDLFILLTDGVPSLYRHSGSAWVQVGGSGSGIVLANEDPATATSDVGDVVAVFQATSSATIPTLRLLLSGTGTSLESCVPHDLTSATEPAGNVYATWTATFTTGIYPVWEFEDTYDPWRLFDGGLTYMAFVSVDNSGSYPSDVCDIGWKFTFPTPVAIASLSVIAGMWDGNQDWRLEGSNDDVTYSLIASGTDSDLNVENTLVNLPVTNSTKYTYYKLLGRMQFGDWDGVGAKELYAEYYPDENFWTDITVGSIGTETRVIPSAATPTAAATGTLWWDSNLNKLRAFDGTAWQNAW